MSKDKTSGHRRYDEPVDHSVGADKNLTPLKPASAFALPAGAQLVDQRPILPEADQNDDGRYAQSLHFANWVHQGQVRKYNGLPYVTHPLRCSRRAFNLLKSYDVAIGMALHDGPEDQIARCPFELITALYGERVCNLVQSLTNPSKKLPHLNRVQRKSVDRQYYETAPVVTKICKAIDRIDNLGELDVVKDPGFAVLYTNESILLLEALRSGMPSDARLEGVVYRARLMFDELETIIKKVRTDCGLTETKA